MYDRIEVTKRGVFMSYTQSTIEKLNADIRHNFHHIFPIEKDFNLTHAGVSRLVMLDRYSQKDRSLKTLGVNDIVVTIVKEDPKFPSRGIGIVLDVDREHEYVTLKLEEEFRASLENEVEASTGIITRPFKQVDKPLEIYYEQIANVWVNHSHRLSFLKNLEIIMEKSLRKNWQR